MRKKGLPVIIILGVFCFYACLKEPKHPSWDTNILAPLFNTSLGVGDFLPDSLAALDSSGFIHVAYNEVLYEYTPGSILEIPDTITSQAYQAPFSVTLQPNQLFLNKNEERIYKFGEAKLSQIKIKKGYVNFQVTNTVNEAILMTYSIPMAKKDGVPFELTELVPAANGVPYTLTKKVDISGYVLDMRGTTGLGANIIGTNFKARLNPDGVPTPVTPQDSFVANIKFEEFTLSYARGYFGSVAINLDDTSNVDIFKIIKSGHFELESMQLALQIVNGFGIDAQMVIHQMGSLSSLTNNNLSLQAPMLGQTINVMRATETGNPSDPVIPTTYPLNLSNTNVKDIFESMPDKLTFKITGQANPLGNISGGNDFYYDGNGLKLMVNLDIPLALKAHELTLADTVGFNFKNEAEYNTITHGTFHLIADNGFPFDARLQLLMADSNNVILDSLLFNNLALAAPLNNAGMVVSKKRTLMDVPLPESKIDKLENTKKLVIKAVFNTQGNNYIKLYDTYRIDLKMTGDFNFLVKQ
ncbi:MAG: hypothetical protein BWY70_00708 [Bacteroidetes bacterium ADurb.Bin408]|nr:MAG: hypothetical protein BWY70_00708 [Bacteroidetes bacterium ADurb.Bin408]